MSEDYAAEIAAARAAGDRHLLEHYKRKQRRNSDASRAALGDLGGPVTPAPSADELARIKSQAAAEDSAFLQLVRKIETQLESDAQREADAITASLPNSPAVADKPADPAAPSLRERYRAAMFSDISEARRTIGEADQVIADFVPARGLTTLTAQKGSGKTVALVDLAMSVATDSSWQGKPTLTGWCVCFIASEDSAGTLSHMEAWTIANGKKPDPTRFRILTATPDLLDSEDTDSLVAAIGEAFPIGVCEVLVILDTWQRATAGASQNDDDQMQTAIRHAERIASGLNGAVIAATHPAKSAGKGKATSAEDFEAMGSSIVGNSASGQLVMTDTGGWNRRIVVTKQRGPGLGASLDVAMDLVRLGAGRVDRHGAERTGRVLRHVSAQESSDKDRRQRSAMAAAIVLLDAHRGEAPEFTTKTLSALLADICAKGDPESLLREVKATGITDGMKKADSPQTWRRVLDRLFPSHPIRPVSGGTVGGATAWLTTEAGQRGANVWRVKSGI